MNLRRYPRGIETFPVCTANEYQLFVGGLTALVAVAILALAGCSSSQSSRNVQPGDLDYPKVNLHPTDLVEISVIAPPGQAVSVFESYESILNYIPNPPPSTSSFVDCGHVAGYGSGGNFDWTVSDPIPLKREGDTYHGWITRDKYMPGRCHWHFAGAGWSLARCRQGSGVTAEVGAENLNAPVDLQFDVWTVLRPDSEDRGQPLFCASLDSVVSLLPKLAPRALVGVVPADQRHPEGGVISSNTKSITVEFHDLDALKSAQLNVTK